MTHAHALLLQLVQSNIPALPTPWLMRAGLALGWALALAWLGARLAVRCRLRTRAVVAGAMALWACIPGPLSLTYWLGLAFHAPSLTTLVLCAVQLRRLLSPALQAPFAPGAGILQGRVALVFSVGGVLLGYALLLDTLALLPVQLYAWGFSPLALLLLLPVMAPMVWQNKPWRDAPPLNLALLIALLVFSVSRVPTGNMWDAIVDPWLCIALHVSLVRGVWRRWRARR